MDLKSLFLEGLLRDDERQKENDERLKRVGIDDSYFQEQKELAERYPSQMELMSVLMSSHDENIADFVATVSVLLKALPESLADHTLKCFKVSLLGVIDIVEESHKKHKVKNNASTESGERV